MNNDLGRALELLDNWNENREGGKARLALAKMARDAGHPRLSTYFRHLTRAAPVPAAARATVDDFEDHFRAGDGFPLGEIPPEDINRLAVKMGEEGFNGQTMRDPDNAFDWIGVARNDAGTRFSTLPERAQKFWLAAWNAYRAWMIRQAR